LCVCHLLLSFVVVGVVVVGVERLPPPLSC
jgi:hypothetical protein